MTTLTVSTTTNFSSTALAGIDVIDFTNLFSLASATFKFTQFDNVQILDDLLIDGSVQTNRLQVNGGSVDASGWTFANWGVGDSIIFESSIGDDLLIGSSQRDTIHANVGSDTIFGGLGLDFVTAGGGDDLVRFTVATGALAGESVDGGNDHDTLAVSGAGLLDFSDVVLTRMEALLFEGGGTEARFRGPEVADVADTIAKITASADVDTLTITGETVDLTGVQFIGWSANDLVKINGKASFIGNLSGSDQRDSISGANLDDFIFGAAGADTMAGGAGDDEFLLGTNDFAAGERIDGGIGSDTVSIAGDGVYSFRNGALIGIETIDFANVSATARLSPTQAATASGLFVIAGNEFDAAAVNVIEVSGRFINMDGIRFLDWDANDIVRITASNGDDLIGGSMVADIIDGTGGVDTIVSGNGADVFDYDSAAEIGNGIFRDVITDFQQGVDLIDLDDIDALVPQSGVQHFTFIGKDFHLGFGGSVRYEHVGGITLVTGDIEANGLVDFTLELQGVFDLTAADFTDLSIAAVQGTAVGESLAGSNGVELVTGLAGNDTLSALGGADTVRGGEGFDTMTGGGGPDRFDFNAVAEIGNAAGQRDVIADFEQGSDLIDLDGVDALTTLSGVQHFTWLGTSGHTGAGATLRFQQSAGNTLIFGDVDANGGGDFTIQLNGLFDLTAADFTNGSISFIQGTAGNDTLTGAPGGKTMHGLDGNDTITGGAGADTIVGGAGIDLVTGGLGADRFKINSPGHTGANVGTRDIIADFQQGVDKIDLSAIDANTTVAGNQTFTFLGTLPHTGNGATLRFTQSGGNTVAWGDVNADGVGDFAVQLTGLFSLVATDFVL